MQYVTWLIRTSESRIEDGYPKLAAFQSMDRGFSVYRQYRYLQARLLLEKQDQLRLLEETLDSYDTEDPVRHTRKGLRPQQQATREVLLAEIEAVFLSYCMSRNDIRFTDGYD